MPSLLARLMKQTSRLVDQVGNTLGQRDETAASPAEEQDATAREVRDWEIALTIHNFKPKFKEKIQLAANARFKERAQSRLDKEYNEFITQIAKDLQTNPTRTPSLNEAIFMLAHMVITLDIQAQFASQEFTYNNNRTTVFLDEIKEVFADLTNQERIELVKFIQQHLQEQLSALDLIYIFYCLIKFSNSAREIKDTAFLHDCCIQLIKNCSKLESLAKDAPAYFYLAEACKEYLPLISSFYSQDWRNQKTLSLLLELSSLFKEHYAQFLNEIGIKHDPVLLCTPHYNGYQAVYLPASNLPSAIKTTTIEEALKQTEQAYMFVLYTSGTGKKYLLQLGAGNHSEILTYLKLRHQDQCVIHTSSQDIKLITLKDITIISHKELRHLDAAEFSALKALFADKPDITQQLQTARDEIDSRNTVTRYAAFSETRRNSATSAMSSRANPRRDCLLFMAGIATTFAWQYLTQTTLTPPKCTP